MWQDKDAKGLMRGTGQIYNNLSSQAAQRSYSLLMDASARMASLFALVCVLLERAHARR